MDAIKKFAVIVTGLAIIGVVIYLLYLSGQSSPQPALASGSPAETVQPQNPPTLPRNNEEQPPASERPPEEVKKESTARDTIAWRMNRAPRSNTQPPEYSSSIPRGEDPNFIFTNAAQRILPAVVAILSARHIDRPSFQFHPFLFPDDKNDEGGDEKKEESPEDDRFFQPGSGSGIIISHDGYIMTNYHVVEGAELIRVTLYDKRIFTARFVGSDPTTDVALLKIESNDLPAAYIGNSDSLQIGEWVIAVGNPLNFASTVTSGIISAMGRDIRIIDEEYRIENFIQTDAVINPGNSGGALVNLKGEVIGINTAIATRNGYYQGYGFAIPINLAKKVVSDILKYGVVKRALLGVSIEPVTDRVARAMKLPKPYGALVQGVHKGYPAEDAGFHQGDIILAVDGKEVSSVNDLQIKIAQHHPGDLVHLTVWRDGREWEVELELGEAPSSEVPEKKNYQPEKLEFKDLGISARDLSESDKSRLDTEQGIFIEKVTPGSPASDAGIPRNTILLSINKKPIHSVEEFEQTVKSTPSGEVLMCRIKSLRNTIGDNTRLVFVEVP